MDNGRNDTRKKRDLEVERLDSVAEDRRDTGIRNWRRQTMDSMDWRQKLVEATVRSRAIRRGRELK